MLRRNRIFISKAIGGALAAWFFVQGGIELLEVEPDGRAAGIALIVMGIIALVTGLSSTANAIHRTRRISYLIQHGQPHQGTVSHFDNMPVRDQVRPGATYRIIVETRNEQGEPVSYSSDPVAWLKELGFLLHHKIQVPATVFVNPENKKEYYVDIDTLNKTIDEKIKSFQAQ